MLLKAHWPGPTDLQIRACLPAMAMKTHLLRLKRWQDGDIQLDPGTEGKPEHVRQEAAGRQQQALLSDILGHRERPVTLQAKCNATKSALRCSSPDAGESDV